MGTPVFGIDPESVYWRGHFLVTLDLIVNRGDIQQGLQDAAAALSAYVQTNAQTPTPSPYPTDALATGRGSYQIKLPDAPPDAAFFSEADLDRLAHTRNYLKANRNAPPNLASYYTVKEFVARFNAYFVQAGRRNVSVVELVEFLRPVPQPGTLPASTATDVVDVTNLSADRVNAMATVLTKTAATNPKRLQSMLQDLNPTGIWWLTLARGTPALKDAGTLGAMVAGAKTLLAPQLRKLTSSGAGLTNLITYMGTQPTSPWFAKFNFPPESVTTAGGAVAYLETVFKLAMPGWHTDPEMTAKLLARVVTALSNAGAGPTDGTLQTLLTCGFILATGRDVPPQAFLDELVAKNGAESLGRVAVQELHQAVQQGDNSRVQRVLATTVRAIHPNAEGGGIGTGSDASTPYRMDQTKLLGFGQVPPGAGTAPKPGSTEEDPWRYDWNRAGFETFLPVVRANNVADAQGRTKWGTEILPMLVTSFAGVRSTVDDYNNYVNNNAVAQMLKDWHPGEPGPTMAELEAFYNDPHVGDSMDGPIPGSYYFQQRDVPYPGDIRRGTMLGIMGNAVGGTFSFVGNFLRSQAPYIGAGAAGVSRDYLGHVALPNLIGYPRKLMKDAGWDKNPHMQPWVTLTQQFENEIMPGLLSGLTDTTQFLTVNLLSDWKNAFRKEFWTGALDKFAQKALGPFYAFVPPEMLMKHKLPQAVPDAESLFQWGITPVRAWSAQGHNLFNERVFSFGRTFGRPLAYIEFDTATAKPTRLYLNPLPGVVQGENPFGMPGIVVRSEMNIAEVPVLNGGPAQQGLGILGERIELAGLFLPYHVIPEGESHPATAAEEEENKHSYEAVRNGIYSGFPRSSVLKG